MPRFLIPALLVLVPVARAQTAPQPSPLVLADNASKTQARDRLQDAQKLMSQDDFEKAALVFQEAATLDPLLVMAHYGLGAARMAQKEYAAAVPAFESAQRAFHERASELLNRRSHSDGIREDRIRALRNAIRHRPDSGTIGVARAEVMVRAGLEAELALLETTPQSGPPRLPAGLSLALGSAYFRNGRLQDAEREYRTAIDAQPKLGEPRTNLAVVLLITGRPAEAKEQVKLAEKSGFKVPAGLKADVDKALAQVAKP